MIVEQEKNIYTIYADEKYRGLDLENGEIVGKAKGRGETLFVKQNGTIYAKRKYKRGGLISHLIKDSYLWLGLQNTRAYRELELTKKLVGMGLNVPKVVLAKVQKRGIFYQAKLVTELIDDAISFDEHSNPPFFEIGKTIRKFHNAGLDHTDLNARNILISGDLVYLIDFDKCTIKAPRQKWQQANLERLKRSLIKLDRFDEAGFEELKRGYHE